jgi:hypothetical protein
MTRPPVIVALTTVVAIVAWLSWLGFHAPYTTDPVTQVQTGPYEPWQVVGLGITMVVVVLLAARLRAGGEAVAGSVTGLALIASADWGTAPSSDGLWVIGVGMLVVGATLVGLLLVGLARPRRTLPA